MNCKEIENRKKVSKEMEEKLQCQSLMLVMEGITIQHRH